jgi:hypothetical protein
MIDARFRPLPHWPEKRKLRFMPSQFKSPYNKTLDKLEYELGKLNARNIVIEAGFAMADIRNDGWPRGKSKPSHPGVILYFTGSDGAMRFPSGTYNAFEANMHAIALTLENLRAIDRYGVTLGHEQYLGFKQIAAPPPVEVSAEAAARVIEKRSGIGYVGILRTYQEFETACRMAIKNTHTDGHPDRDPAHFRDVLAAKGVLEVYFDQKAKGASQ